MGMKQNFYLFLLFPLLFSGFSLNAQTCADCRFISPVFDSVTVETVKFGEGQNSDGQNQELFLDFYQPYGDTAATRPVIIFAFGGGFIQGSRDESYVVKACERFAQAGYVAASIDYRIGFDLLQILDPISEAQRVLFRAMQDMRASAQYMRYHADSMGNAWRLDTNMIMIGGASAGAITALMVEHCDKDAEFGEIGSLSSINSLGGFYSTSGPHTSYSWESKATINIAGALVNASWVEPGDMPILSVHGDQDGVVPYQGGNLNLGIAQLGLEGSYLVDEAADSAGVCSFLHTIVGGDHPSGSMSDAEMDAIFNQLLGRMEAVVYDRSFCCALDVEIDPNGEVPVQAGTPLTLNSIVTGDQGNATIQWCSDPCGISSTGSSLQVTANPGEHVFAIIREGNCQNSDFTTFTLPVGIEQPAVDAVSYELFPNPAQDLVTLSWEKELNTPDEIRVFNLQGQLLKEYRPSIGTSFSLPLGSIEAGLYLVEIQKDGQSQVVRFVKE